MCRRGGTDTPDMWHVRQAGQVGELNCEYLDELYCGFGVIFTRKMLMKIKLHSDLCLHTGNDVSHRETLDIIHKN